MVLDEGGEAESHSHHHRDDETVSVDAQEQCRVHLDVGFESVTLKIFHIP